MRMKDTYRYWKCKHMRAPYFQLIMRHERAQMYSTCEICQKIVFHLICIMPYDYRHELVSCPPRNRNLIFLGSFPSVLSASYPRHVYSKLPVRLAFRYAHSSNLSGACRVAQRNWQRIVLQYIRPRHMQMYVIKACQKKNASVVVVLL